MMEELYTHAVSILGWLASGLLVICGILVGYIWVRKDKQEEQRTTELKAISQMLSQIKANSDKIPGIESEIKEHSKKISELQEWKSGMMEWRKQIDREKN